MIYNMGFDEDLTKDHRLVGSARSSVCYDLRRHFVSILAQAVWIFSDPISVILFAYLLILKTVAVLFRCKGTALAGMRVNGKGKLKCTVMSFVSVSCAPSNL